MDLKSDNGFKTMPQIDIKTYGSKAKLRPNQDPAQWGEFRRGGYWVRFLVDADMMPYTQPAHTRYNAIYNCLAQYGMTRDPIGVIWGYAHATWLYFTCLGIYNDGQFVHVNDLQCHTDRDKAIQHVEQNRHNQAWLLVERTLSCTEWM